jgi:hypothetical protein
MTALQDEWARCRDWIAAALPAHLYAIEDIERGIADGGMQFWPGEHCAAVTEFALYPNCKVLNVLAAGGKKGRALKALTRELEPCLLEWARASDCKYVMGFGIHDGWKPVTGAMGYAFQWLVMIKEVKD